MPCLKQIKRGLFSSTLNDLTSKFAIFLENEKPGRFFRFSFRASLCRLLTREVPNEKKNMLGDQNTYDKLCSISQELFQMSIKS